MLPNAERSSQSRVDSRSVTRGELLVRLAAFRRHKLTLLISAAGMGKTSLMAQWRSHLVRDGARVAWVAPRNCADTPTAFFIALRAAIAMASTNTAGSGLWWNDQKADTPASLDAQMDVLIRELASIKGETWLMIDDAEQVRKPQSWAILQAILDAALPDLHVVVASRRAPKLMLGRLRAMGQVGEMSNADLMFSWDESLAFLKLRVAPDIGLDMATRFHWLCAGWPAGLQLLAAALAAGSRQHRRSAWVPPEVAGLEEYLFEDVFKDASAGLSDFMQALSVLPRFNVLLAATVSGQANAQALIESIGTLGLALLPGETEEQRGDDAWYRLPPMVLRCFRKRLAAAEGEARVLHLRAMAWFAERDYLAEAILHALKAEAFDVVPALVERAVSNLPSPTQLRGYRRWLDRMPSQCLAGNPRLLLLAGWANVATAEPARACAWLSALEAAKPGASESMHGLLLRAAIAMQCDEPAKAEALLRDVNPVAHPAIEALRLGLLAWLHVSCGRHVEARVAISAIADLATHDSSDPVTELAVLAQALDARISLWQDSVLEATRLAGEVLAEAEGLYGHRSVGASSGALVLAEACYERGCPEQANAVLADRLDVLRLSAPDTAIGAILCCARLHVLGGRHCAAQVLLSEAEALFRRRGIVRGAVYVLAERVRIALRTGDSRQAVMLRSRMDELIGDGSRWPGQNDEISAVVGLARARLALSEGDSEGALAHLALVRAKAEVLGKDALIVAADLLEACALALQGSSLQATQYMEAAFASACRLELVRTLVDEGEPVRKLLADLPPRPAGTRQARHMLLLQQMFAADLAESGEVSLQSPVRNQQRPIPGLTPREQQVLDLLVQAMSNKRIALALNISELTVKWHLRQIFEKMGVSRRYDAIAVARKVECLPG